MLARLLRKTIGAFNTSSNLDVQTSNLRRLSTLKQGVAVPTRVDSFIAYNESNVLQTGVDGVMFPNKNIFNPTRYVMMVVIASFVDICWGTLRLTVFVGATLSHVVRLISAQDCLN